MTHFSASNLLTDCRNLAAALQHAGFAHDVAYEKASLFASAAARLPATDNPLALFIPGRLEFLGKHTDYAGGRSIVACVERGFCAVASMRNDNVFHITDATKSEQTSFEISPELSPTTGHWSNYPMTVARRVARNFGLPLRGLDMAFASDLPAASGMSSSSAFMIACFFALMNVNQLFGRREYSENIHNHEDLAGYLATIENGQTFASLAGDKGVGTFGGSQDHTAILACQANQLRQYAYCPVRLERSIAMPAAYTFAIACTGVAAEKTGQTMEQYNRASLLARAAADKWNAATQRADPHLAAAIQSDTSAPDRLRTILRDTPDLLHRLEQFHAESNQIVPAAGDALVRGDMEALGALTDRSQKLAEALLGNQIPETTFLVRSARTLDAPAASAFGAGFGGSVWAIVQAEPAERFLSAWRAEYQQHFPNRAADSNFFLTRPGPPAARLFA